jgi:hypothetical protein
MRMLLALAVVAACSRSGAEHDQAPPPNHPTDPDVSAGSAVTVTMTHTDPKDPASWAEAQKIAAAQNAGTVTKRSDALPFMFQADRAKCVLIHKGQVITKRGPVVAGDYLRDLGIAKGTPPIDDVLWALWALDALPNVAPLSNEGYVNVPNDQRLSDLTARTEWDGQGAHIVLHYFKPDPTMPKDVHVGSNQNGTAVGGGTGGTTRALVRMTLDIPEHGDASWRREDINWADPG